MNLFKYLRPNDITSFPTIELFEEGVNYEAGKAQTKSSFIKI